MADSDTPQDHAQSDPAPSPAAGARRGAWALVAASCVPLGALGSVLGAHSIASHDASKTRSDFHQDATASASALKLGIQREEELAVSTSTFFARDPEASPEEFSSWVNWARTIHRFPELADLGLVAVVPSS